MSELVVTNPGERYLLDRAIRTPWPDTEKWVLRLFVNDFTPCKDMVIADVTEATYPGYLPQDLARADWSDPVTINGTAASWNGTTPRSFATTGPPVNVYGYYVTVPDAGDLFLLAERFDAVHLLTSSDPVLVAPQLTLHSESEPTCPP